MAELSDRVYAATGITLKPGYEVRWVRENSGKEYKRFYCPAGKRYSSPGELIAALKKQHEKEQAEGECERRNLAAEMDLAADDAPAKAAPRKVSNVARDRQRRGAGKDARASRAAADQTRAQVRAQEANQGSDRV